jgi:hypothetical protein
MRWAEYVERMGRRGTRIGYLWESQRERGRKEDQNVGRWIILEWILQSWDGVKWTWLIWLRIGTDGKLLWIWYSLRSFTYLHVITVHNVCNVLLHSILSICQQRAIRQNFIFTSLYFTETFSFASYLCLSKMSIARLLTRFSYILTK